MRGRTSTEDVLPSQGYRVGAFVRSGTNRFGLGKIAELSHDRAVVEYFHSTAKSSRETIPLTCLRSVVLPPQTRCYFRQSGHWAAGHIGRHDDRDYEVDLPHGRATYMPEDALWVRTNLSIEDPTEILAIKAHDTAFYHEPRREYLNNVFQQCEVSRGLTGVLSARIKLLAHQLRVVRRVVEDPVQRYLLADEVGLGKTIEAGCILRQFLIDNPGEHVLVLVPDLLCDQWEQELDEKFDCNGLDGEISIVGHRSIGTVRRKSFGLVIIDEAQHPSSWAIAEDEDERFAFERLRKIAHESPRLILLSATPVLHNEREFLTMLHLLSPEVYGLGDLETFRLRVSMRQEIGRILVGLQPNRPGFLLRTQARKLLELLPRDVVLGGRLQALEALLNSDAEPEKRADCVREIRVHISEAYRLHRRMLRNRRSTLQNGLLLPRLDEAGGSRLIEEWDSDERSELVQDAIERWRLASREFVDVDTDREGDSGLRAVFVILLQAASSDLDVLSAVVRSRVDRSPRRVLLGEMLAGDCLWTVPLFETEAELLHELLTICGRKSDCDRVDDAVQLIRNLRTKHKGRKFVIFTGFECVCKKLLQRMHALPDFAGARAYYAGLEADEIEDALAEFRAASSSCDVLICDRAGEEGRNLQFADYLIHFDIPWNPNRLEQRIGRLDRIGRTAMLHAHVFVGPDIEGSLSEAWYRVLKEAFEIFSRSIASLQMFVDRAMPAIVENAWLRGAAGLVDYITDLKAQITEELNQVAEQDILDEVDSLERDATPWVSELQRFDSNRNAIQNATESWIVGALRFDRRRDKMRPLVSDYRPSVSGTHVPFDLVYAEFANVLTDPITYDRDTSVRHPGTQLLRTGAIFVDKMTEYLRWDDRGQAFAYWRKVADWDVSRLWTGFAFTFIVEPDLQEASELARHFYSHADTSALRRQANAWYAPQLKRVLVDSHAEPVQDPDLLNCLAVPYRKRTGGGTDVNLTGERLAILDNIIDPDRWAEICHAARDAAAAALCGSDSFQKNVQASLVRAQEDGAERTNTLRARASYSHGTPESELLMRLELDMEREVGAALQRGISSPRIYVDAAGFIVLSGRDFPSQESQ